MTMSHGSESKIDQLVRIGRELQEVFAERSHHVGTALEADPAFGRTSRRSESTLSRDLALEAIARALQGFDEDQDGLESETG